MVSFLKVFKLKIKVKVWKVRPLLIDHVILPSSLSDKLYNIKDNVTKKKITEFSIFFF